jgi:hypothetical protein
MGGAAATSGAGTGGVGGTIGGTGPSCIPWPTPANDPACPSPGVVTTGVHESACTPELSCEFLVPTGDPCFQPPRLQRFECCEWGFALMSCPSLPEGQEAAARDDYWLIAGVLERGRSLRRAPSTGSSRSCSGDNSTPTW